MEVISKISRNRVPNISIILGIKWEKKISGYFKKLLYYTKTLDMTFEWLGVLTEHLHTSRYQTLVLPKLICIDSSVPDLEFTMRVGEK